MDPGKSRLPIPVLNLIYTFADEKLNELHLIHQTVTTYYHFNFFKCLILFNQDNSSDNWIAVMNKILDHPDFSNRITEYMSEFFKID